MAYKAEWSGLCGDLLSGQSMFLHTAFIYVFCLEHSSFFLLFCLPLPYTFPLYYWVFLFTIKLLSVFSQETFPSFYKKFFSSYDSCYRLRFVDLCSIGLVQLPISVFLGDSFD
jgi:hypothetical protein